MTPTTASLVLQGGNLGLLAVVLVMIIGGVFRLSSGVIPVVQQLVGAVLSARESFEALRDELRELRGRAICPLMLERERGSVDGEPDADNGKRPTDPEVLR